MSGEKRTMGGRPLFERGDNIDGLFAVRKKPVLVRARKMGEPFVCRTLEGDMRGDAGDYLIVGVQGEPYPCKPDIFEATYEPVDVGEPDQR